MEMSKQCFTGCDKYFPGGKFISFSSQYNGVYHHYNISDSEYFQFCQWSIFMIMAKVILSLKTTETIYMSKIAMFLTETVAREYLNDNGNSIYSDGGDFVNGSTY